MKIVNLNICVCVRALVDRQADHIHLPAHLANQCTPDSIIDPVSKSKVWKKKAVGRVLEEDSWYRPLASTHTPVYRNTHSISRSSSVSMPRNQIPLELTSTSH